ncbi:sugar ABC transporter ATP-binding protein [Modestobacter roseus]|uniref:Ribose transport system ATP-binding protein n=1 Tax=Modestobacter roseus TaxID=1181884 RepID=A0A562IP95_9ACTN|nr:sugar ABC transporter ATP-binding protein [Modestobacter roseus]MQA34421.1 ATP-binding cassette domain-containing protein [Modestobacter roseus]TWH72748.1 ribose transport system ATP-binding protein [Modestobacter roseus]
MTVSIRGLTKRYGATLALDDVDLDLAAGEVHALLGHNGAGKSTVIKCLGGGTSPSAGTIEIDGTEHRALDPRSSIAAGIAVIYQHLSLIDRLSVTENLFLGQETTTAKVFVRRGEQRARAVQLLARVGLTVPPDTPVRELTIGQRQLVEIAKALSRDARLLVLDEPSAALSPVESRRLAGLVRQLKGEGIAVLYVTHLLNEVVELADRTTVMRDGRVVWSSPMAGVTKDDLVTAVSGRAHGAAVAPAPVAADAAPVLSVDGLRAPGLPGISLTVRPGEIVGLYGLVGAGRSRLLETLFGRRRSTGGTVHVDGQPVEVGGPDDAIRAGLALVPGDRLQQGLFGSLSSAENTVMRVMSLTARAGWRRRGAERQLFRSAAEAFGLRPADPSVVVSRLSGGNQQKVLIARWVNDRAGTRVLLLDDPTQGVDVGARSEIYRVVRQVAAERGLGVLFASNDPDEVVALAHRCLIMRKGRVVDELDMRDTDEETLLDLIHRDLEHTR